MRKLLIGAVLTLCFMMFSLALVGKQLPRPTADAPAVAAWNPGAARSRRAPWWNRSWDAV